MKPSLEIIFEWMTWALGLISEGIIINSFMKNGISNILDGIEYGCVWE
jgi:hypothetical protein